MLSLTPLFTDTYIPTLSACNMYASQFDHDLARMFSDAGDHPKVYPRQPNYSLVENDQQAHLEIELPGVAKENVNLDITDHKLSITANRFRVGHNVDVNPVGSPKDGKAEANEKDTEQPKPSVVYQLKIRVGHRYDTDNIQAAMEGDGILKMVIPMKKRESPRKIQIE